MKKLTISMISISVFLFFGINSLSAEAKRVYAPEGYTTFGTSTIQEHSNGFVYGETTTSSYGTFPYEIPYYISAEGILKRNGVIIDRYESDLDREDYARAQTFNTNYPVSGNYELNSTHHVISAANHNKYTRFHTSESKSF